MEGWAKKEQSKDKRRVSRGMNEDQRAQELQFITEIKVKASTDLREREFH